MKIVTFPRKNDYPPKRVVDFPLERDTFRNKIMEIVDDFDEKSYNNNNNKPWKSSKILRVKSNFIYTRGLRGCPLARCGDTRCLPHLQAQLSWQPRGPAGWW